MIAAPVTVDERADVFDFAPPFTWGDQVKRERMRKGWSMRELAERAGYSGVPSTVMRMERWPRHQVVLSVFFDISDALGFEVVWQPKRDQP